MDSLHCCCGATAARCTTTPSMCWMSLLRLHTSDISDKQWDDCRCMISAVLKVKASLEKNKVKIVQAFPV